MTPRLGVCYYPEHWPEDMWAEDAREMVEMGLSLVRIGEFAWSRLEPREGEFHFEWLDRAINTLGSAGLKVVLGTPSATPPKWIVDKFPDMLAVDKEGRPRKFGSRRHYCFSHQGYREFAAQMASRLAERYADNDHIEFWQTDNEYGCHDTTLSYSDNARKAFRHWLKERYGNKPLNETWGNVFWSMDYETFDDVDLPNLTVTEPNPAHSMDFRRFTSEQVRNWDLAQVEAIRKHCSKPISHNYMGRITEFDHFRLGDHLDIATWDSYPLGFLEDRSDRDEEFKHTFSRMGDPDFQAFHHDLYRTVGKGRWGVMEQQPGPVNWAPYNPAPKPGMVRVWSHEAFAHGAEFVCYFRWRQPSFAQEQMHTALKRPDNTPYPVCDEIRHVATEIRNLTHARPKAEIGLVFDYRSQWAWEIQPQGQGFDYFKLVFEYYGALRQLGVNIDIVDLEKSGLSDYKALIIPGLFAFSDAMKEQLDNFKGHLILGPRTNSKDENFKTNLTSVSAQLGKPISLDMVESLRPGTVVELVNGGHFKIWNECHKTEAQTEELKADGYPAVIRNGKCVYMAGWPNSEKLLEVIETELTKAGCKTYKQPGYNRRQSIGMHEFQLNYEAQSAVIKG